MRKIRAKTFRKLPDAEIKEIIHKAALSAEYVELPQVTRKAIDNDSDLSTNALFLLKKLAGSWFNGCHDHQQIIRAEYYALGFLLQKFSEVHFLPILMEGKLKPSDIVFVIQQRGSTDPKEAPREAFEALNTIRVRQSIEDNRKELINKLHEAGCPTNMTNIGLFGPLAFHDVDDTNFILICILARESMDNVLNLFYRMKNMREGDDKSVQRMLNIVGAKLARIKALLSLYKSKGLTSSLDAKEWAAIAYMLRNYRPDEAVLIFEELVKEDCEGRTKQKVSDIVIRAVIYMNRRVPAFYESMYPNDMEWGQWRYATVTEGKLKYEAFKLFKEIIKARDLNLGSQNCADIFGPIYEESQTMNLEVQEVLMFIRYRALTWNLNIPTPIVDKNATSY